MKTRDEIRELVYTTIKDQTDNSIIEDDDNLVDDLDLDDLDFINVAMALEEELGIDLPDEDFSIGCGVETVKDLVDLVERKLR